MTDLASTIQQFRAEWSRRYRTRLPFGWQLRIDQDRPWVRFHALPFSKRYADDEAERATILNRANSLGDRILGPGTPCWVVESRDDESEGPGELWMASVEGDEPDSPMCRFYIRADTWQSGKYDEKLLAIADDEIRAIWMRRDNGAVFAPYDGGFDLFPSTWEDVALLKEERPDWLSDHPAGL